MSEWENFGGRIGRYRTESEPWWPEPVRPPDGAPNVLIALLDDVGFAQFGCYGSDIDTPTIDGLAARGLRYTNFHTTALCSPTRACLLTGRSHHRVGMGRITDLAAGFPGYHAHIDKDHGFLSEMLTPAGYASYCTGKWHLTADDEQNLGASRARWPLGRGFERFYGFFGGETHQFAPSLVHDNHRVAPPRSWENGYHFTEDIADRAIEYVADLRHAEPDKPFFLYFTPGACHSPHQAPPEWIERYRGRFDAGWDAWREATFARQLDAGIVPSHTELSHRPEWVPAWDSLPADQQALFARFMECFAGFLSHTDHQLGRVVDFLEQTGDLDNTLVMVMSDNGASSEGGVTGSVNDLRPWNVAPRDVDEALGLVDELGGPRLHNNYPWGWTVAGNTPFRRWKREVHEGGVADPLVVAGPGVARPGEIRRQYVHVTDIVPTVLEVIGVDAPAVIDGVPQSSFDGMTFAETLADADAPSRRQTQYFEMLGCRAIYDRGWKAVVYQQIAYPRVTAEDEDRWELYNVEQDPSECHDLATEQPEKLRELVDKWWVEAERNGVLPIDNAPFEDVFSEARPHAGDRPRYVYFPFAGPVTEEAAVSVRNRSHTITAEVTVEDGAAPVEGVLLAQGSIYAGYVLYAKGGRLHYVHNYVGLEEHRVSADLDLAPGDHALGFRFTKTGEHRGTGALVVDGAEVGAVEIPRFTPTRFSITGEGLCCGYDIGMPVVDDYRPPFAFTATLHRVVVDVGGEPFVDPESEVELSLRSQ